MREAVLRSPISLHLPIGFSGNLTLVADRNESLVSQRTQVAFQLLQQQCIFLSIRAEHLSRRKWRLHTFCVFLSQLGRESSSMSITCLGTTCKYPIFLFFGSFFSRERNVFYFVAIRFYNGPAAASSSKDVPFCFQETGTAQVRKRLQHLSGVLRIVVCADRLPHFPVDLSASHSGGVVGD